MLNKTFQQKPGRGGCAKLIFLIALFSAEFVVGSKDIILL